MTTDNHIESRPDSEIVMAVLSGETLSLSEVKQYLNSKFHLTRIYNIRQSKIHKANVIITQLLRTTVIECLGGTEIKTPLERANWTTETSDSHAFIIYLHSNGISTIQVLSNDSTIFENIRTLLINGDIFQSSETRKIKTEANSKKRHAFISERNITVGCIIRDQTGRTVGKVTDISEVGIVTIDKQNSDGTTNEYKLNNVSSYQVIA